VVNFSVFNEKSLPLTQGDAINVFGEFFNLLGDLKNKGLNQIRMTGDFKHYPILENISFQKFFGQQRDREFKARLRSFITNGVINIETPIIKKEECRQEDALGDCEYLYNQCPTIGGLACCDIWNTLAVSFNSSPEWDCNTITLQKQTIEDDDLTCQDVSIYHASNSTHLQGHQSLFNALESENRLGITQGTLWSDRNIYFPNIIIFCPEIEAKIQGLDNRVFKQVISLLRDVEMGRKKITDYNCSRESQSVRNDEKLKQMRMFTVNDSKVFFERHVKSLPTGNRMYFLEKNGKLFIGYIGNHLPTKKY